MGHRFDDARVLDDVLGPSATSGIGDNLLGNRRKCFRSFSGETQVLVANGEAKPISEVEVGDWVLAEDLEEGVRGARRVTHLWIHQDVLVDLSVGSSAVSTTEDHPFWNHSDAQWQEAQRIDKGDLLVTAEIIRQDIGGDIHTFQPPEGVPQLGKYELVDEAWSYPTVVVKEGRVYDQFTGSGGMWIDDWKTLWTYGDLIDFGF